MKCYKHIYICTLLLVINSGCREPFYPNIERYENILVIDGLLTDQEGPHIVKLSRSFAFDENLPEPEEGAAVMIIDDNETIHTFTEVQAGIYHSNSTFRGTIGQSYKLVVSTTEQETYESDWVMLKDVPEIDSVSYALKEQATSNASQPIYGMQVKINTHDETNSTRYYRWEWLETWEYITPIKSSFYPDEDRCWRSARSNMISVGTSEHLSQDLIEDYPLFFISTENNKLRIRYSVLVFQYSLSQEAYSYWKSLQDITQNMGTLFDPTPAMVTGNIYNSEDQDKPVLGIFQASAVKQERIFIDRDELPKFIDIPSGYSFCNFYDITDSAEIDYYSKRSFPLVDIYVDRGVEHLIFSNSEMCFRCTLNGSNERPDFWTDP